MVVLVLSAFMTPLETQVRQTSRANRRSKRLQLIVPVEVIAFEGEAEAFRERARMLSVNANGGLLLLGRSVLRGQLLRLVNQRTAENQECRVVSVEAAGHGRFAVGITFTCPTENFWKISFPPLAPRIEPDSGN